MRTIFHLTNPTLEVHTGISQAQLRRYWRGYGHPYSVKEPYDVGAHPQARFTTCDVVGALRAYRPVGRLHFADLIEHDRDWREGADLRGAGLWLGDQNTARAVFIEGQLTGPERNRYLDIRQSFREGVARAFWDRVMHLPPKLADSMILHPEVFAATLGADNNLPETPTGWSNWSAQFVLSNVPSSTVAALAA